MESSSHKIKETQRQREVREQIKHLQAQLTSLPGGSNVVESPKKKRVHGTMLAPATPSPKKKRKVDHVGKHLSHGGATTTPVPALAYSAQKRTPHPAGEASGKYPKPAPSNLLGKLSKLSNGPPKHEQAKPVKRSYSLLVQPNHEPSATSAEALCASSRPTSDIVPNRDDRLAIIEQLEVGPTDHKPPSDDPQFERLEPNSGIRLLSRSLPHDDLQEYLRGRYYLSPSKLYSCIRMLPNKSGYDVPVEGDWITIAVVAERGPVRTTRAPIDAAPSDDAPRGKKYVNMKLIDFGARSRSSSAGKASIGGDAFLTLLMFEADSFDRVTNDNGSVKKIYTGGSKGAFEAMSKLKEGDVITLLNPKVLKPFQRNNRDQKPHPTDNVLAVTPESAESIAIIGRAQDLGMCGVLKRDGKVCGSWTDKRVSDVCDWHLTNSVQRQRASRPEFSAGTSGMTSLSSKKRKLDYDPQRQWGLQPAEASGSCKDNATYVVAGHVVNGSNKDGSSLFVAETMGREGQARAKRKLAQDADRELKGLLERDKEGMRAVTKAREIGAMAAKRSSSGAKDKSSKGKQKAREADDVSDDTKTSTAPQTRLAYSAEIIKRLGFDPAAKMGQSGAAQTVVQDKIAALAAVHASRKEINLGPRPGDRIRSGVVIPAFMLAHKQDDDSCDDGVDDSVRAGDGDECGEDMIDLDD